MMEYKGYQGVVEYDPEAHLFSGEVIGMRDVITFQGYTVKELEQAFRDSVDDYLEFCAQRGEKPEKPFSGKFALRIDPELHQKIALRAKAESKSMNHWIRDVLANAVR